MTPSARVVITKARGRLETRSGVLYGRELGEMLAECYARGQHAIAYAHDHRAGDPIVGESDPPRRLWHRDAPPLRDRRSAAAYGPSHA